jgi:NADH-quinone oxidoreductase subunit N
MWLAVIGVITSVVSGYYYLRVVYLMYMYEGDAEAKLNPAIGWALGITAVATLILGFLPGGFFELTRQAALIGGQLMAGG